jgi:hypothetical protein
MGPLPVKSPDGNLNTKGDIRLRKTYILVGLMSLLSELLSVVWATVAVNQLTETFVPVTESVWQLLTGPYSLAWSAVNAHFVFGTIGFAFCVGLKVFYHAGKGLLGKGLASVAVSGLCLMTAIVNRGIASGGGDGVLKFGNSVLALFSNYARLLFQRATRGGSLGLLEISSGLAMAVGLGMCLASILGVDEDK